MVIPLYFFGFSYSGQL